ncbi:hypothetical protein Tco_0522621 [Tanacetum coccineum]
MLQCPLKMAKLEVSNKPTISSTLKRSTANQQISQKDSTQAPHNGFATAPNYASHSDEIICSFFSQQASMPTTHDDEDLLQIDEDQWKIDNNNEDIDWTKEFDAEPVKYVKDGTTGVKQE